MIIHFSPFAYYKLGFVSSLKLYDTSATEYYVRGSLSLSLSLRIKYSHFHLYSI